MSKTVKRKITVELPEHSRDSSQTRRSVFQRLGNKRANHNNNNNHQSSSSDPKQQQQQPAASIKVTAILAPSSSSSVTGKSNLLLKSSSSTSAAIGAAASGSRMKHHSSKSSSGHHHHHRLDDADPALLEQKRAELKKELEIQMKMESAARKSKVGLTSSSGGAGAAAASSSKSASNAMRKRKQQVAAARRSSSSSSSSSSGSDSSSDSSSSDSGKGAAARRPGGSSGNNNNRKNVKTKRHHNNSSSSSDGEDPRRKVKSGTLAANSGASLAKTKRVCHKKLEAAGNKVKSHHSKKSSSDKMHGIVVQQRKRSPSPSQIVIRKHQRPISPGVIKSSTKSASKSYSEATLKHHRLKETIQPPSSMVTSHHRDKDREFQMRERERNEQHLRSRERVRSRSPMKSNHQRSPGAVKHVSRSRELKQQRSPPPGASSSSLRRPPSKTRTTSSTLIGGGLRRGDRTPERIIIKKDVSGGGGGGKRHETSREREHRRERDREREAALREKERIELMRAQERAREQQQRERVERVERVERDRVRVKVVNTRDSDMDQQQRTKTDRLLPRPAERAMALAAARDRSREKSEDRGGLLHDPHHRPRSHSRGRSGGREMRGSDRVDVYGERGYDRVVVDDRYEMHRRMDKDRSSAGLIRDDRSDRDAVDRDRDYLLVRRREDSRGRIIEESIVHDPYMPREKIRGPNSERNRSMDRERERESRNVYASDRDRERMHGDHGRYEDHIPRGSMDDRRMDRGGGGGSDRGGGHDYGRPSSRGGYIDDGRGSVSHRAPQMEGSHRGDRGDRDGWHRGDDVAPIRGDERSSHLYDRHSGRDWDRNDLPGHRQPSAGRVESNYPMDGGRRDAPLIPDWSAGDRAWDDRRSADRSHGGDRGGPVDRSGGGGHHVDRGNWQHPERDVVEKWNTSEDYGISDYHRGPMPEKIHHDVEAGAHHPGHGNNRGAPPVNRRWPPQQTWRGGRGGGRPPGGGGPSHHVAESPNLFRRQNPMHNAPDNFADQHQGDHHFRRHPGGNNHGPHGPSGDYQPALHHGHNAFSTSIVRPLLSLPPLKPPIMDDNVPMISPSMVKIVPVSHLNNPIVNTPAPATPQASIEPPAKEEVVPTIVATSSNVAVPVSVGGSAASASGGLASGSVSNQTVAEEQKESVATVSEATTATTTTTTTTPSTTTPTGDPTKEAIAGENGNGGDDDEGDALSEISDDADEILNRQEEEAAAAAAAAVSAAKAAAAVAAAASTTSHPMPIISQKPALLPTPPFKVGEYPRLLIHPPYANPQTANNLMNQQPPPSSSSVASSFDDHLHHMHQHHVVVPIKPLLISNNTSSSTTLSSANAAADMNLNDSAKDEDLDLDFEEISDAELEEEARIRGLGDALGVDWASLVEESKAKSIEQRASDSDASAKQRWQPHRILLDVGVSFRMAGKEFASNVLNAAHRQLKADEAETRRQETIKQQELQQKLEEQSEVKIKKEIPDEDDDEVQQQQQQQTNPNENATTAAANNQQHDVKPEEKPQQQQVDPAIDEEPEAELLIHPIACVQVASRVNAEARKNLVFGVTGPYSRALSSHRDIQMRRQLCGLSVKRCAPIGASASGDGASNSGGGGAGSEYAVIARQLFEKALGKVN